MARVTLEIGGHRWPVSCRDGEEPELLRLGAMLAERWDQAQRAAGDAGTARVMLLIALMLADELTDLQERVLPAPPPAVLPPSGAPVSPAVALADDEAALHRLADRLEALAAALERP